MKKIIATVIIVLAVMFTPQGVYADSEEQNNEYYDRLISEINEGLSFEGDEDVKTVLEDNNITLEDPSSAANINAAMHITTTTAFTTTCFLSDIYFSFLKHINPYIFTG